MAMIVVAGAAAVCSFGTGPGTIYATSQTACLIDGKPVATIQDATPSNVTSFTMCTSLANPQVAAATAAAMGVLTPQPCTLAPAGVWIPSKPGVLVGGQPCLTNECKLLCSVGGGTITITSPGQSKVVV